jgi:hypothetical protein
MKTMVVVTAEGLSFSKTSQITSPAEERMTNTISAKIARLIGFFRAAQFL